jgi:hypothetical protein
MNWFSGTLTLVGLVLCAAGIQAQTSAAFYTNTDRSQTANFPIFGDGANELADDIPFTGTYRVDRFVIGYNIGRRTPVDQRNLTVRFYQPDPVTGLPTPATKVAEFVLTNINAGGFDIEDIDLAAQGKSFLWSAGTTFGGEQGGILSLQFPDANGSWYLATGGGSADIFDDIEYPSGLRGQDILANFGPGNPEASFYAVIYGQAVPEPSVSGVLLAGSLTGVGILLRRRRLRK